jgi:hypothetical protein
MVKLPPLAAVAEAVEASSDGVVIMDAAAGRIVLTDRQVARKVWF